MNSQRIRNAYTLHRSREIAHVRAEWTRIRQALLPEITYSKSNHLVPWPVWTVSSTDHRCDLHFCTFLHFSLVPSEGKASECISWWQRYFGMPSIPLFEKEKKPKKKAMDLSGFQKSQLSSFQVNHNCCTTESNCTSHQPNMNRRYPTPAGRWCQLLWRFCHFGIQTRIFDVQLQHLTVSIQFGQVDWASNL